MTIIYLSGLPTSAPEGWYVQHQIRSLFGLTTPEVYPATPITRDTGGLLPHLFTLTLAGGYFLRHCLFPVAFTAGTLAFARRDALCCPDFPHPPLFPRVRTR